jgi:pyruvate, orthophosphate dikinase
MGEKLVYLFREGDRGMRDLLGGKGAGLAEMTTAGAPVPPGFTITTAACNAYTATGDLPSGLWEDVLTALGDIERQTGRGFGDAVNPLLVSVRSGAKFSMPGMMDTVLNLGLNDKTVLGLAAASGDERFAADAYRRFIQLFGKIVLGIDGAKFEHVLEKAKGSGRQDTDLSADELAKVAFGYRDVIRQEAGREFPQDPQEQLRAAIAAVFRSWNGRRAVDYRRLNKISDDLGTAVNVQAMVFGNLGATSGTGVAFSRNPSTGENVLYGEYLVNAQGEDVVAGIRTPTPIAELRREMPEVYRQFEEIARQLEGHYADMQDMEFTVERGRLYMLQTRTGKRTGAAAVRIAVEMAEAGVIDRKTAVLRVEPSAIEQLLHPTLNAEATARAHLLTRGLPASPGAATGEVVFDPDEAVNMVQAGHQVILVRRETAPEDFHGMVIAEAVLTARGGMTSHAAVVARGMGKPCVVGAGELRIDEELQVLRVNGHEVRCGQFITLNGATGEVFLGRIETEEPELSEQYQTLMAWADEFRTIRVRTNADSPQDAAAARRFGAEGIGLCRTEHMFFQGDRIDAVREMIVAETGDERRAALAKVEPYQRNDFARIFREMDGLPVTIRTLDPPLHEFLPKDELEISELAEKMGIAFEKLRAKIDALVETNPMLGFRGCRLGIAYPEITEMQARAIFAAAKECREDGIDVRPEVMIPLVNTAAEFENQAAIVRREAEAAGFGDCLVGTMIEVPRAALVADEIAAVADFFSFGTNDLTQTTMGISRDDSARFVPLYLGKKILANDPFQVLDQQGVGQLVTMAIERGRGVKPGLKIGVCGEHGGEPSSVEFFVHAGLDYVSCSPFRVPVARLAAAHAALTMSGSSAAASSTR